MAWPGYSIAKAEVVEGLRTLAKMIENDEAFLIQNPTIEIQMERGPAVMKYSLSVVTDA